MCELSERQRPTYMRMITRITAHKRHLTVTRKHAGRRTVEPSRHGLRSNSLSLKLLVTFTSPKPIGTACRSLNFNTVTAMNGKPFSRGRFWVTISKDHLAGSQRVNLV